MPPANYNPEWPNPALYRYAREMAWGRGAQTDFGPQNFAPLAAEPNNWFNPIARPLAGFGNTAAGFNDPLPQIHHCCQSSAAWPARTDLSRSFLNESGFGALPVTNYVYIFPVVQQGGASPQIQGAWGMPMMGAASYSNQLAHAMARPIFNPQPAFSQQTFQVYPSPYQAPWF